jgi:hypothetical protein
MNSLSLLPVVDFTAPKVPKGRKVSKGKPTARGATSAARKPIKRKPIKLRWPS